MKLTDTHLMLLGTAAQHEERLLPRPDRFGGKAAQTLATKLVRAGLAEEVSLRPDQPHWRMDDESRPVGLRITGAGFSALGLEAEEAAASEEPVAAVRRRSPSPIPRPGTKRAYLIALLQRAEGASLDDLIAATGWLPHTTRAALTGLRQKGYALAKSTGEDGRTRYNISSPQPEPIPETATAADQGA